MATFRCLECGHQRTEKIPECPRDGKYCRVIELDEGPAEAIEAIREDLREILSKPAPEPTFREVTTKWGHTFKIRS